MARPPRLEHQIEHTRAFILDAAARVFASRGFAASSIEDIAREAGYAPSSLYAYFKGKQAIVRAIIERFFEEQERSYEITVPSGLSLRQSLELLLSHQLAILERRRDGLVFLLQRGAPEIEGAAEYVEREGALQARLAQWIEQRARPGELGKSTPTQAGRMLSALVFGQIHDWTRDGTGPPLTARVTEILDFFFHGVAGPPAGARDEG